MFVETIKVRSVQLLMVLSPPKVIRSECENYDFFREKLAKDDPEAVYRGIGRLVVVDVKLERNVDDPQLIFESLNSTGLELSQSDLIRNFILMRLPDLEQTRLYGVILEQEIEKSFPGQ